LGHDDKAPFHRTVTAAWICVPRRFE